MIHYPFAKEGSCCGECNVDKDNGDANREHDNNRRAVALHNGANKGSPNLAQGKLKDCRNQSQRPHAIHNPVQALRARAGGAAAAKAKAQQARQAAQKRQTKARLATRCLGAQGCPRVQMV